MNQEQLKALLEYVEALIEYKIARHDPMIADCLLESVRADYLLEDLKKLFP